MLLSEFKNGLIGLRGEARFLDPHDRHVGDALQCEYRIAVDALIGKDGEHL